MRCPCLHDINAPSGSRYTPPEEVNVAGRLFFVHPLLHCKILYLTEREAMATTDFLAEAIPCADRLVLNELSMIIVWVLLGLCR